MDVWKYNYKKVYLITKDGEKFIGIIIDISEADETERHEPCISLELSNGRILGFYESEVLSIEEIQ